MNDTVASLRGRLNDFLGRYNPTQKRNMAVTLVFLIIAVVIAVWAATRPHFVTIMSGLDNKSLGQVQTQLETLKIPNQIDGSSVLVPSADANTARVQLAMAGLPQTGYIGYSQVSSSPIGMTDQQFNLQVLNALQENLDQTIQSMNGVESAQVYIVQPQPALFVTDQTTGAKASVFVQVGAGNTLSAAQVAGIQTLVAHSVTGMSPSDVAVVDQNGVPLSGSADASAQVAGTSSELALRQNLESTLQQTISSELNQIVGYGNAVVAVKYNVSFNQVRSSSTRYVPAAGQSTGLIASQQKTSQNSTSPSGTAGGLTGQSSSNPGVATYPGTSGTGGNSTSQSSSSTTNYDNSVVTQQVVGDPMQIQGIDVSVLLNSNNKSVAITNQVQNQIRQFVSGLVGKSGGTNNSITVSAVPFQQNPLTVAQKPTLTIPTWAYAAGALALIGGGVLVARRRRKPESDPLLAPAFEGSVPADDLGMLAMTEDEQMREQLVRLANQKPDDFVNLLRTWLVGDS